MKVTNQGRQNADLNSVKTKTNSGVEGLENLGKNPAKVSTEKDKADAATVALSPRAQDMKKIKELALKAPDVNAAKVKKFQDLIDSGQYKVDASKVSDKMVDSHLMMAMGDEE